ncbi:MAG: hypothetical protein IT423_02585, partial [Pirellulaceae bacterium]|nr:hypothetical protein [Pirellulaceae bacterium]
MIYHKFLFALCLSCATLSSSVQLCAGDRGADEPTTPAAIYGQGVRETNKLSPAEELAGFHLPTGFVAELVASEPQIAKPLNMAFDAQGRLWVTDTTEYPYPVPAGQEAHDSIKVLADLDQNGSFESVTTFASGLNIPIGILPVEDGVICFSIPNIMHLKDTDGDGQCDEQKVLLGPFDTTRDTHGMVNAMRRGPDGWIYACHGFNNQSHVKAADGSEIHLMSGNTFRFRADGSHVEQFTTGQVNPFGMTSDQWGNWFTADCHSKPVTMLVRGGHYESFGRPHDGLGFVPAVMDHLHGSTAICGISYYMAEEYPPEFRGKFYSGNVMTSRINCNRWQVDRDRLRLVEEPDFMTSDDPWFRPVDVQLGADGALYVADFYNKIIGHYEVRLDHPERDRTSGRIWRIVYRGQTAQATNNKPSENNSGQDSKQVAEAAALFSTEHLAELTHANATRRHFALERIRTARLSPAEQAQLIEFQRPAAGRSDWLRIAAIWSLHTHVLDTETTLADALTQASPQVTVAVLKAWADRGRADQDSRTAASRLLLRTAAQQALGSDTPQVALAAADALAEHGTADDVTLLLNQIHLRTSEAAIVPHAMRIAVKRLLTRQEIAEQVLIRLTDKTSSTPTPNRPILDASKIDDWLTQASIVPAVDTPRAAEALLAMVTSIQDKRMAAYRAQALQLACKHMRPEFAQPVVALLNSLPGEDDSLSGKGKSTADLLSSELDQQSILAMEALSTLRSGQHPVPAPLSQLLQQKLTSLAAAMDSELRAPDSSKVIVW